MLRQKILVIVVIALMQTSFLHAKSLGIAQKPAVVDEKLTSGNQPVTHSTKRTASASSSTCSPTQDQLEQYGQLYNANAVSTFGGNLLYYALRAMQVHQSRLTGPATTAEEDNAVIASITDQNRFTPAGMETANRAICAKILQELDTEANLISKTALCAWDYYCDYRADRFPSYIFKARCRTKMYNGNCSQNNNGHGRCISHAKNMNVLEMRGSCGEWGLGYEVVQVACTCTSS